MSDLYLGRVLSSDECDAVPSHTPNRLHQTATIAVRTSGSGSA
jgi:hypothetical protein